MKYPTEHMTISGKEYPIRCEDDLQIHFVSQFKKTWPMYRRLIHHSPNEKGSGTPTGKKDGAKARNMGTQKGWPDIEIMVDPPLFIELKFGDEPVSQDQLEVIEALRMAGHRAVVCRSYAQAWDVTTEHMQQALGRDV
jgi:hypothetical protein